MPFELTGRLALAAAMSLFLGCVTQVPNDPGTGGVGGGGAGGAAGEGGVGGAPKADSAGLWIGESNGIRVCLFINDAGDALTSSSECALGAGDASSYGVEVDEIGRDENGEPCSFELDYAFDVGVDPLTGAFEASFMEDGSELAFSGTIVGLNASGVATRIEGGSSCTVGWAAARRAVCDTAAINACLELQTCCRAILVNPVYFQSCDSVVLDCNEQRCRQVLAGYPQCEQLDL